MAGTEHQDAGVIGDARLRALYKLAQQVDGEELERVREAIARRRSELEQAEHAPRSMMPPPRRKRPERD